MSYDAPKYERGNIVYLRESAASGFLETHTIAGVARGGNNWIYTVYIQSGRPMHAPHYGERRSMINGATLTFEECEFIGVCDALQLAVDFHDRQLNILRSKLASYCDITSP